LEKIKVAAIQFDVLTGEKEENIAKASIFLDNAGQEGVHLAVLPEYFSTMTPGTKEDTMRYAEPIPGPTVNKIGERAKRYGIYVVAGVDIGRHIH